MDKKQDIDRNLERTFSKRTGWIVGSRRLILAALCLMAFWTVEAQKTHQITVYPKPTVTTTDTVLCVDEYVRLTLVGQPPFALTYTVDGNHPSTLGLPTVFNHSNLTQVGATDTFTAQVQAGQVGLFVFRLTGITDNRGCGNNDLKVVNILVHNLPSVRMAVDTVVCQGDSIPLHFTGKPPFVVTYSEPTLSASNIVMTVYQRDTAIVAGQAGNFYFQLLSLTDSNSASAHDTAGSVALSHVFVHPKPMVTNTILREIVCSDAARNTVPLYADHPDTVFTWWVEHLSGNISGYTSGGIGNYLSAEILTNTSILPDSLIYHITAITAFNCVSDTTQYVIVVNPTDTIQQLANQYICSGDTMAALPVTSSISGAVFAWTSTAPPSITGNTPSGTGNLPDDILFNSGNANATVIYTIVPTANACQGAPYEYTVTVHPQPVLSLSSYRDTVCSGDVVPPVSIFSTVTGATYAWKSTAGANISGNTPTGTGYLPPNQLTNSGTALDSVVYELYALSLDGCQSDTIKYVVCVNPTLSLTLTSSSDTICNGDAFTPPTLPTSGGITYTWTITPDTFVSGLGVYSGSGMTISSEALTNHAPNDAKVIYHIVPTLGVCQAGTATDFTVVVRPQLILNSPLILTETVASGEIRSAVSLTANHSNATFRWTSIAQSPVTGNTASGTGNLPDDTLINNGNVPAIVTYRIVVNAAACESDTFDYIVTVNPQPSFIYPPMGESICSGDISTGANWTSNVANANFTWTASSATLTVPVSSGVGNLPPTQYFNTTNAPDSIIYIVRVHVNGNAGDSIRYVLIINPIPSASTGTLNNESICSGETFSIIYLGSNVNDATFAWTTDIVGTITGVNPTYGTGDIIGTQLVSFDPTDATLTYNITPSANGCTGATVQYTITIKPKPTITNTQLSEIVCSGEARSTVSLTSDVVGATFEWSSFAGSSLLTGNTPIGTGDLAADILTNAADTLETATYKIVAQAQGCFSDTVDYLVNVNPSPTATPAASQTLCFNDTLDLISFTGTAPWTLVYNDGTTNQTISNITSSPYVFIPTSDGTFTFNLVSLTDATACTATATGSAVITVNPLPTIVLTSSSNIIQGDSMALFTLTGVAPWTVTYSDGVNTQTVTVTSSPYMFGNPIAGNYTFTLLSISDATCTNDGVAGQNTVITVDSMMLPFDDYVIIKWNNVFMLDLKQLGLDGYEFAYCSWFENGVLLDTGMTYCKGNELTDIFKAGAVYHFELTTADGRVIRSTDKIFQLETRTVVIYPNPVRKGSSVTIDLGAQPLPADAKIQIYSINGSLVNQVRATGQRTEVQMDVPAGMYLLKLEDQVFKVVVK